MANKILNLIFKVKDEASGPLKEITGKAGGEAGAGGTGMLGVGSALEGMIKPALALGGSLLGIGYILKGELTNYTEYITEVGNLASSLNITVKEASALSGAMDTYDISATTMISAFARLTAEGIEPTIAGLQSALYEYDLLSGIDKSAFANELFGPAGVREIIPWWESLTELQKERLGYQEQGLAVTQEMSDEVDTLKTTTSLLTTEWDTMKGLLIEGVMPTLITIGQYIYVAMDYARRLKGYLAGLVGEGAPHVEPGYKYGLDDWAPPTRVGRPRGRAYGGDFTVGGTGGIDSTPVSFMATPGETVSVGGGITDNEKILAEMRRLVDTIPTAIADAVGRT